MAPKELFGRYKLYKAGTNKLINWLAKSADRCCDIKSIVKSLGTHLNTKPSKQSKRGETSTEIRTQELIKLAEAIASSKPPVDIPQAIIDIAEDVIAGREECANWYAAQALEGGGELEKENESHRFFILVLQRVANLLSDARAKGPKVEPTKTSKKPTKPTAAQTPQTEELNNLFACLEVEEPSATPLGEHAPSAKTRTPFASASINFKLKKEDDDLAFATWCFLQDLHDVRDYVRGTWLEYSRGDISFLAASSITDTAFGLLRCADEEFAKSTSQNTDWPALMHWLGLDFFTRGYAVWMCPTVPGSRPRVPNSKINVVELLCPLAYMVLQCFAADARAYCHNAQRRHQQGLPPESVEQVGRYQYHRFCTVLYKLAPELHDIAHSKSCEHVMVDEFVQGLVDIHGTTKTPTWLVVACQIYLDIYDLLGNYFEHGVEALQETFRMNRKVAADIEEYRAQCSNGMSDVHDALEKLEWVATACNRFEESNTLPAEGANGLPSFEQLQVKQKLGCSASAMERSLPAHAGAILADLKIGMHDVGCRVANHCRVVLSMAHLYKALRSRGLLQADWHDMDFVLAAFGTKQPLVAKASSRADFEATARHYLLALGVPATEFAVGGRRDGKGSKAPMKEARKITITSPFLQAMSSRQMDWEEHGLGYSKYKTVEVVLQSLALSACASENDTKNDRRSSQLRESFTPLQLLATFRKAILADEPQLNFDYTSFTVTCARLLQDISEQALPHFGFEDPKDWHWTLVASLLRAASSHKAIASAVEVLQAHIAEGGKKLVKQAYNQSSGRIPKHLRPRIEQDLAAKEASYVMMRTMLDYSGTKYSFSGHAISAYHPGIISECCSGDGGHHGGETDPFSHQHCHDGHEHCHEGPTHAPVIAFGSVLPKAIVDEGMANARKDPGNFDKMQDGALLNLFAYHADGKITERMLRETVGAILGIELVRVWNAPKGVIPWAYLIDPDHQSYDTVFGRPGTRPEDYGCSLVVAADKRVGTAVAVQ